MAKRWQAEVVKSEFIGAYVSPDFNEFGVGRLQSEVHHIWTLIQYTDVILPV